MATNTNLFAGHCASCHFWRGRDAHDANSLAVLSARCELKSMELGYPVKTRWDEDCAQYEKENAA